MVLDWPLVAAVLHTGGAAAILVVLTWGLAASKPVPPSTTATELANDARSDQNKQVRAARTTKVSA